VLRHIRHMIDCLVKCFCLTYQTEHRSTGYISVASFFVADISYCTLRHMIHLCSFVLSHMLTHIIACLVIYFCVTSDISNCTLHYILHLCSFVYCLMLMHILACLVKYFCLTSDNSNYTLYHMIHLCSFDARRKKNG
jgi:hypothetical protein